MESKTTKLFYMFRRQGFYFLNVVALRVLLLFPWCEFSYCFLGESSLIVSFVRVLLLFPWCEFSYCFLGASSLIVSFVRVLLLFHWCEFS